MRGKAIGLVLVVLALLLLATPGLAAGGGGMGSKSFNLIGAIVSYNCPDPGEEEYIIVDQSWPGNPDEDVTVLTNGLTQYKQCTSDGPGSANVIACSDLVTGYEVRIIGEKVDSTLLAERVIQYIPEE